VDWRGVDIDGGAGVGVELSVQERKGLAS
jgi:hypothetical protein